MREYQHVHGTYSRNQDGVSRTHYTERFIPAYGRLVLAAEHKTTAQYEKDGEVDVWYHTIVPGFLVQDKHKRSQKPGISNVVQIPRCYRNFTRYLLEKEGLKGPITFKRRK